MSAYTDFIRAGTETGDALNAWLTGFDGAGDNTMQNAFDVIVGGGQVLPFTERGPFTINEPLADGDAVGTVVATGATGYAITQNGVDVDGDGILPYAIDAAGDITVLDAGDLAAGNVNDGAAITVEATDGTDTNSADVTINIEAGGGGGGTVVNLDGQGTDAEPATLDAGTDAFSYTDSAAVANNVIINNYGADDSITVSGATQDDYNTAISSDAAGDVTIAFNSDGTLNQIVLPGVAVGSFAFDVDSFNALSVGDLSFA
jgi:hypothetical protein